MSGSLDRPTAAYSAPGPDQQTEGIEYHVQAILQIASSEGPAAPDVQQGLQMLMAGLHAIATQKGAQGQQGPPQVGNQSEDFGSNPNAQPLGGPQPGAQFTNLV